MKVSLDKKEPRTKCDIELQNEEEIDTISIT